MSAQNSELSKHVIYDQIWVQNCLDDNAKSIEEWTKLLDRDENTPIESIPPEDIKRHSELKRKLHDSLGNLAKIVQLVRKITIQINLCCFLNLNLSQSKSQKASATSSTVRNLGILPQPPSNNTNSSSSATTIKASTSGGQPSKLTSALVTQPSKGLIIIINNISNFKFHHLTHVLQLQSRMLQVSINLLNLVLVQCP